MESELFSLPSAVGGAGIAVAALLHPGVQRHPAATGQPARSRRPSPLAPASPSAASTGSGGLVAILPFASMFMLVDHATAMAFLLGTGDPGAAGLLGTRTTRLANIGTATAAHRAGAS